MASGPCAAPTGRRHGRTDQGHRMLRSTLPTGSRPDMAPNGRGAAVGGRAYRVTYLARRRKLDLEHRAEQSSLALAHRQAARASAGEARALNDPRHRR